MMGAEAIATHGRGRVMRAAWMFEDRQEGSAGRGVQVMYTALTRLYVVAAQRPLRPVVAWLARILG